MRSLRAISGGGTGALAGVARSASSKEVLETREFLSRDLVARQTTEGAGRWTYCKYCYKNVQPFILIEETPIIREPLSCCSECGAGLESWSRRRDGPRIPPRTDSSRLVTHHHPSIRAFLVTEIVQGFAADKSPRIPRLQAAQTYRTTQVSSRSF